MWYVAAVCIRLCCKHYEVLNRALEHAQNLDGTTQSYPHASPAHQAGPYPVPPSRSAMFGAHAGLDDHPTGYVISDP